MIQNMEGLVSKNSKEKVELLKEYVKEDNIIIMNLTETHLDETIEDVVDIEGYNIFRGDRMNRVRGGTAIYVHDKIDANIKLKMSNGKCEVVAVEMPDTQWSPRRSLISVHATHWYTHTLVQNGRSHTSVQIA